MAICSDSNQDELISALTKLKVKEEVSLRHDDPKGWRSKWLVPDVVL